MKYVYSGLTCLSSLSHTEPVPGGIGNPAVPRRASPVVSAHPDSCSFVSDTIIIMTEVCDVE